MTREEAALARQLASLQREVDMLRVEFNKRPVQFAPQENARYFFLVKKDGGFVGGSCSPASWTYSLYLLSDTSYTQAVATGVTVQGRTPMKYHQAPDGSIGMACQLVGGGYMLLVTAEVPYTSCDA